MACTGTRRKRRSPSGVSSTATRCGPSTTRSPAPPSTPAASCSTCAKSPISIRQEFPPWSRGATSCAPAAATCALPSAALTWRRSWPPRAVRPFRLAGIRSKRSTKRVSASPGRGAGNEEAMEFSHRPVLLRETVELLAPDPGKLFLDGTLGGGGHAAALLEAGARVIGLDQDPRALDAARTRLAKYGDRFVAEHANFRDAAAVLARRGIPEVDGALVDLGVSSAQLDDAGRGFSFQRQGPLDMRMDSTRGTPLAERLARWPGGGDRLPLPRGSDGEAVVRAARHGMHLSARSSRMRLRADRGIPASHPQSSEGVGERRVGKPAIAQRAVARSGEA